MGGNFGEIYRRKTGIVNVEQQLKCCRESRDRMQAAGNGSKRGLLRRLNAGLSGVS